MLKKYILVLFSLCVSSVARVDGVHQFTDDLLFCLRLFKKILGDGIFRNDFTDVDAGAFIEEVSAVTLIEQPSGTVNDRIGVRDRVGKSHTRISVLLDVLPAERRQYRRCAPPYPRGARFFRIPMHGK